MHGNFEKCRRAKRAEKFFMVFYYISRKTSQNHPKTYPGKDTGNPLPLRSFKKKPLGFLQVAIKKPPGHLNKNHWRFLRQKWFFSLTFYCTCRTVMEVCRQSPTTWYSRESKEKQWDLPLKNAGRGHCASFGIGKHWRYLSKNTGD